MIGLSTMTFDLNGALLLNFDEMRSDISSITRRITRQQTLDGGAYFSDSGHSSSDNTLTVLLPEADEALDNKIRHLVENYSLLFITTRDGAFTGGITKYNTRNGSCILTILIAGGS